MGPGIAQNGNSNREGDENKVPLDIPFLDNSQCCYTVVGHRPIQISLDQLQ